MKYKIKNFLDFLGKTQSDTYHIYVRITQNEKYNVLGLPARNNKFVKAWNGRAQVYVSVNLCRMMTGKPKISDVTHWVCEYVDLDCEREDHSVPATDEELDVLMVEIERIDNWLEIEGFLPGYKDFTGNGFRWLLPVPAMDLRPLNAVAVLKLNEQKKEWLRILKRETDTNVDTGVGELSRITGIPGTMNVKSFDERDRRREPFRGCVRVEDLKLRDYIIGLDIKEDKYLPETTDYPTQPNETLNVLMGIDGQLKTLIEHAQIAPVGKRSNYDYAIAKKMLDYKVPYTDCVTILHANGTIKARKRLDYVRTTVTGAYLNG